MQTEAARLGRLDCVIASGSERPELAVVLCHGFGAPGTDLVPLAYELAQSHPRLSDRVAFVFPAAPLSLDDQGLFGGRAWWPLDVEAFMSAIQRGALRDQRGECPPELSESRELLLETLEAIRTRFELPTSRLVLGGFSQGSMLATDVALRLPEPPAALCVLSGSLICENQWRALAPSRAGLPVLQSHGRYDVVLPFVGAEWLRDLLSEAGLNVDFTEFAGDHTIPFEVLEKMASLLISLA